ncbi:MAG TPA: cell division protein FtsQ/DivIB, partial [Gammaproteobacteria bacterium]|nr:cell division protein FtsQ/DivIB [Gammaproteobacteria bacterium]
KKHSRPATPRQRGKVVPFRAKSAPQPAAGGGARLLVVLRALTALAGGVLMAGVALWLWWWATESTQPPLRTVRLEGVFQQVSAETVHAVVRAGARGNFFTVDLDRVRVAVEALPWVKTAVVQRLWPDTLRVRVVEQTAVARWGGRALLNEDGVPFVPEGPLPAGLPRLNGPPGTAVQLVQAWRQMNSITAPLGLTLAELELDQRRAWRAVLSNGMVLILGRGEVYPRLLRFVRFYHRAFGGEAGRVARVDLRYSNGFAVRWKAGEGGRDGVGRKW